MPTRKKQRGRPWDWRSWESRGGQHFGDYEKWESRLKDCDIEEITWLNKVLSSNAFRYLCGDCSLKGSGCSTNGLISMARQMSKYFATNAEDVTISEFPISRLLIITARITNDSMGLNENRGHMWPEPPNINLNDYIILVIDVARTTAWALIQNLNTTRSVFTLFSMAGHPGYTNWKSTIQLCGHAALQETEFRLAQIASISPNCTLNYSEPPLPAPLYSMGV